MFYQTRKNLIWEEPKYEGHNHSAPLLVKPQNIKLGDKYGENAF